MGLGTPFRESLSSYFLRLAYTHALQPSVLARLLVWPRFGNLRDSPTFPNNGEWGGPCFNGFGRVSAAWTRVLSDLTTAPQLEMLSLLPLANCLSDRKLRSRTKRWCPDCIQEGEITGQPYGQLLWEIDAVAACPRHGKRLVSMCSCGGTSQRRWLRRMLLPHLCRNCGFPLGTSVKNGGGMADGREMSRTNLVAGLLGSAIFEPGNPNPVREGFTAFMEGVINNCADGRTAAVAKMLSMNKSSLHGLLYNGHLPGLSRILTISEVFQCSVKDVLLGKADTAFPLSILKRPRAEPPRVGRARADWVAIHKLLSELLVTPDGPARTIAEIGRTFRVSPASILRRFPEETKILIARWVSIRKGARERRFLEQIDLIRKTAVSLTEEGVLPSWRKLTFHMNGQLISYSPRIRQVCKEVYAEALVSMSRHQAKK